MPRHRLFLSCLLAVSNLSLAALSATDYYPTRYDDPIPGPCNPTDCSLREAVIAASANVNDADRIFLSAGTYLLTRAGDDQTSQAGDLDLKGSIDIIGAGAPLTTIDAGELDRHFQVINAVTVREVLLRGLTLTNGKDGESISVATLDLVIEDCDITENNAQNDSDMAVQVSVGSTLNMSGTTIRSTSGGTGLRVTQATAFVSNSTFSGFDGEILVVASDATVYCNHCTLLGTDGAFNNVSVNPGGTLQFANSILNKVDCGNSGTLTSFGGNLEAPGATCNLNQATDQDGLAAIGLTDLGMWGGPTPTSPPSPASQAVNAANDTFCNDVDQRGGTRPATDCDSGSVENSIPRPKTAIFIDGFQQGDEEAWSSTTP
jgi:hypothetical protein